MNRQHYHNPSNNYVGLGYPPPAPAGPLAIGNNTNSNDPAAKAARLFVGNINPREVTDRSQLYNIFCQYGTITAISLHKGFAFVQFTSEREARSAVNGENGNLVGTQKLDLCIANEPNMQRPKSGGFKRQTYDYDTGYGAQASAAKKRRFQDNTLIDKDRSGDEPSSWTCAYCKHVEVSAWELMKHAAAVHSTQIYDLKGKSDNGAPTE